MNWKEIHKNNSSGFLCIVGWLFFCHFLYFSNISNVSRYYLYNKKQLVVFFLKGRDRCPRKDPLEWRNSPLKSKIFCDGKHLRAFCFLGMSSEVMLSPSAHPEEGVVNPLKRRYISSHHFHQHLCHPIVLFWVITMALECSRSPLQSALNKPKLYY